jgi:hypothetical protein
MTVHTGHQHTTASCAWEQADMCADNRPGHSVHVLQLRLAAATTSKWLDAIVTSVHADGWIELAPLGGGSARRVWNHEDLTRTLSAGDPVALHTLYNVLTAGRRRVNVLVSA